MSISNATRLSDFGSGIGTQGAILKVDNTNQRVGIGTTNPTAMFSVGPGAAIIMDGNAGVVTATSFSGSGANLTGIAVTSYIDSVNITASGIVTVTNTTASTSTTTGALIVSGGVGIAGSLHVGENVSVGGTLTYEDVTNIDSVGVVTARLGVVATAGRGVEITAGGLNVAAGIATLQAVTATTIGATGDVDIADKIVHTGDTNTAIRFPDADTVAAETGGTERVRIDSSGYVGVGTVSPVILVDVRGTGPVLGGFHAKDGTTDSQARISLGALATSPPWQRGINLISENNGAGHDFIVATSPSHSGGPTEKMRVTSAGIVLVNADAVADSNNLLEVHQTWGGRIGLARNDTSTAAGNNLGQINFYGNDANGTYQASAKIEANADLDHDTGDKPGRLQFYTTPDGSTTPTERLRITSTGAISLNNGELVERCYIQSSPAWSSNGAVNLDNGVVQYNTSNYGSGGAGSLYFTSSVGINTQMATGDIMSLTMMTNVNSTAGYINNIFIDGQAATETWVGGSAPTAGGGSGVDIYTFNIIKTASATYTIIANQVLTSA